MMNKIMNKSSIYKKGLILAIIGLFIGASIVPSVIGDGIKKDNVSTEYDIDNKRGFMFSDEGNLVGQCSEEKSHAKNIDIQSAKNDKWTWMFYDDADFTPGYDPFNDFVGEAYSGDNLDVIVLQDTYGGPAKIWYIDENHNPILLQDLGEVDMGSYQTLRDFINYSKNNYPATRYLLSIYDHGGGWMGACTDDTDDGWLTMDEMQDALTETGGVDIVCFTAPCLMGAVESAYELRDCVDVYVGSEETSGYCWWMYVIDDICDILNQTPDTNNTDLGGQIINLIDQNSNEWPSSWVANLTMSAVRTDKVDDLGVSIDIAANDLVDNINESYSSVWSIYEDVQSFSDGTPIDVYDFAEKCRSVETNQTIYQDLGNVMNNLSEAVIAECHGSNKPGAHGLTIYFPPTKASYNSIYNDTNYGLDFSQNTYWDEFLIAYLEDYDPDQVDLDQVQTEGGNAAILCGWWKWAQSFKPTLSMLTRVKVLIMKVGTVENITISIRQSLEGVDLANSSKSPSQIPNDVPTWIEFDFEDIPVTPDETYYIVYSTTGGDNTDNYYVLTASNGDVYGRGEAWIGWSQGTDWEIWVPEFDFCFKTYGDTAPPEIINVDAQPDSQEVGGHVNISCDVTDNVRVDTVKVNITYPDGGTVNVTMNEGSYYYNTTYTILGTYYYFIWAKDTSDNENTSATYMFTIQDTTEPELINIQACPDPQEVNSYVNISATVTDNIQVYDVYVSISGPADFTPVNVTMIRIDTTNNYYYNATYSLEGTYNYYIWVNDTSGNGNKSDTKSFTIQDTTKPEIINVRASPPTQAQDGYVNITCTVTDNVEVDKIYVNVTGPTGFDTINITMISVEGTDDYYYNLTCSIAGEYSYYIWANDTSNNQNISAVYTFEIYIPNLPPTANFTYTPESPTTADIIQFTDTSIDSDGVIVSWYWDFGDGTNSTEQNTTHKYADDGTYYVNLTITDDDGATDTDAVTITVKEKKEEKKPWYLIPAFETAVFLIAMIGVCIILLRRRKR